MTRSAPNLDRLRSLQLEKLQVGLHNVLRTNAVAGHRRVMGMVVADEVALLVEIDGPETSTERLEADLRPALGVRLECHEVPAGTLPRSGLKSKRIVRTEE